nr:MAG TPA: hypothetical protein [Caudoviricetes sp.]
MIFNYISYYGNKEIARIFFFYIPFFLKSLSILIYTS